MVEVTSEETGETLEITEGDDIDVVYQPPNTDRWEVEEGAEVVEIVDRPGVREPRLVMDVGSTSDHEARVGDVHDIVLLEGEE